jgi:hypothetical protein
LVSDIDPETMEIVSKQYTFDVFAESVDPNTLYIEVADWHRLQSAKYNMKHIEDIWADAGVDNVFSNLATEELEQQ